MFLSSSSPHLLRASIVFALTAFPVGVPTAIAQTDGRPATASSQVDPVSAAIAEASRRFGVPEDWIRSVMRVESAGNPVAVSRAGAMGLMQVMPATYAELRSRYGLGADPFAIRDNILAGTAYLREMYDRYGAPGFLGAYNAGPGRWEEHLTGARPLPGETIGYLARLGPAIGVGSLPAAQNTASSAPSPRPPSPFASPIFVALHTTPTPEEASSKRVDVRQVITANTTLVPSQVAMFVGRGNAIAPSVIAPPVSGSTAETGRPETQRAFAGERPPTFQNPLFVPRSSTVPQP